MIYRFARGRRRRTALLIVAIAVVADLVLGPLLLTYLTIPLLHQLAQQSPQMQGFVDWALSIIP